VDDHCGGVLTSDSCMGCADYSITMCAADQDSCLLGSSSSSEGGGGGEQDLSKCAYELCRSGVLQYMIEYLR
jgi:hypothetical protein